MSASQATSTTGPHVNHYHLRRVASSAEKSCSICYKPTDCVLMSADSRDWFYVCKTHLIAGFATPLVTPTAAAASKETADKKKLEAEVAKVKKEYEEKEQQRKKEQEAKEKGSGWMPSVGGLVSKAVSGVASAIQTPAASTSAAATPAVAAAPDPKEFTLNRSFYQHRVSLKQQAALEKAREQQWKSLSFPSVNSSK